VRPCRAVNLIKGPVDALGGHSHADRRSRQVFLDEVQDLRGDTLVLCQIEQHAGFTGDQHVTVVDERSKIRREHCHLDRLTGPSTTDAHVLGDALARLEIAPGKFLEDEALIVSKAFAQRRERKDPLRAPSGAAHNVTEQLRVAPRFA